MNDSNNSKRLDPRIVRTRSIVLETTVEQLAERGASGVSIESVSSVSGVAKTTIYRHWETRAHLILDAFRWLRLADVGPADAAGDLYTDVHTIVEALVEGLNSENWALLFPSMVEAANRDETVRRLLLELIEQLRSPVRRALEFAQSRGEIRADADVGVLLSEMAGPLFYRRFITREPVSRRLAREIANRVLDSVRVDRPAELHRFNRVAGGRRSTGR